ncbi:RidA family protein [Pseudomonas sp. Z5-35]|uniref:RidA family protein n=1 Tax=unclassified Pseudomonas TaxID=196821 RepID=UPI003DA8E0B1
MSINKTWLAFLPALLLSGVAPSYAQQQASVAQDVSPIYESLEGLPFSSSVRVGPTVYLSGVLGLGSDGRLVEGGAAGQTRQAMDNLKAALERAGSSLEHVAKCTVILADIKDFASMNDVYKKYFNSRRLPARTTFAASLVRDARVEIECVAVMS